MTREIKFRVWDHKDKRMGYVNFNPDSVSWPTWEWIDNCVIAGQSVEFPNIKNSWMQFTGLRDKNGKEIYEGDICQRDGLKQKINFDSGCFLWGSHGLWNSLYQELEVIGNIFEHPELLEKQQC